MSAPAELAGATVPVPAPGAARLRVAVVSDTLEHRNGVDAYYRDLSSQLGEHVAALAWFAPEADGDLTRLSIPFPGDPTQRICFPRAATLYRRLREFRPDVVLMATPGPYGLVGLVAAKRAGARLIAGYHTQFETLASMYWNRVVGAVGRRSAELHNRMVFRYANTVVVNEQAMADSARRLGAGHVTLIGTPIATCFLEPEPPPPALPPRCVLFAGRLAPEKNLEAVVAAAEQLPELGFRIVGTGPLADYVEAQARRLANLEYLGWQPRERLAASIDAADMLVLPSRVEAFGTVALEALVRGRLALVSPACGIARWRALEDTLFTIAAAETLADAIRRIRDLPQAVLARRSQAGIAAARALNEQTMSQWLEVLQAAPPTGVEQ